MNSLPKVFPGKIDRDISNEQMIFRTDSSDDNKKININDIDLLLRKHIAGVRLIVITNNKEYNVVVISKTDRELLTMDNVKIPINDIKYIKKASD